MKTIVTQCVSAVIALAIAAASVQADEPKAGAKDDNKLVGTWKLVSAKWGGTEAQIRSHHPQARHPGAVHLGAL